MSQRRSSRFLAGAALCLALAAAGAGAEPLPGMPPVVDPHNLYSETAAGKLSPAAADALPRVYVPNLRSDDVYVIDPATLKVVDRFGVGQIRSTSCRPGTCRRCGSPTTPRRPTHGSLTPIDPKTGKPGPAITVDDPYNMYFTPDGKSAIVVAEAAASGSISATRTRCSCSNRCRRPNATASTTPISRSTGATRSSPASSTAAWSRSTSTDKRVLGYLKLSHGAACRRTSASRPTARCSMSPT